MIYISVSENWVPRTIGFCTIYHKKKTLTNWMTWGTPFGETPKIQIAGPKPFCHTKTIPHRWFYHVLYIP